MNIIRPTLTPMTLICRHRCMSWAEGLPFMPFAKRSQPLFISAPPFVAVAVPFVIRERKIQVQLVQGATVAAISILSSTGYAPKQAPFVAGTCEKRSLQISVTGTMEIHQMLEDTTESFLPAHRMEIPLGRKCLIQCPPCTFRSI